MNGQSFLQGLLLREPQASDTDSRPLPQLSGAKVRKEETQNSVEFYLEFYHIALSLALLGDSAKQPKLLFL